MAYSQAFQEAFDRMERDTNARDCRDLDELRLVAELYLGGAKWYPTRRQLAALEYEARRRGYFKRWDRKLQSLVRYVPSQPQASAGKSWRHESVMVKGRSQARYRDLKTGRFIKKP